MVPNSNRGIRYETPESTSDGRNLSPNTPSFPTFPNVISDINAPDSDRRDTPNLTIIPDSAKPDKGKETIN